jgi:predicted dehydrogenase
MAEGFSSQERDFVAGVMDRTEARGADAVIVTAAGGNPGLLNRAFEACRKKGRVVLVGDIPIRIHRDRLYRKELDFYISTSYGPGRYDPEYEEKGHDYPLAYVRWTEGRNLEEVLRLIASGALAVAPLTDAIVGIEDAGSAYASLSSETRPIGVLLDYHFEPAKSPERRVYLPRRPAAASAAAGKVRTAVVGYGSYFRTVLLPLLRAHRGFSLQSVCDLDGLAVRSAVERGEFARGSTDYREALTDPAIEAVYVATRHDQHYAIARAAVEAGKAVHVEKPMTLTAAEGRLLADLVAERKGMLAVGFNRRFSPHAQLLKRFLAAIAAPKIMVYRINAGPLPPEHWLLDPEVGGGRLLGEGVHFFDFLAFLSGCAPVRVQAASPRSRSRDEAVITIEFADESVASLVYAGCGSARTGKERVEVFAGGATFVLDDFRRLDVHGLGARGLKTSKVEKGQKEQLQNFYQALRGEADLGVTAEDGYRATWCAERAISALVAQR